MQKYSPARHDPSDLLLQRDAAVFSAPVSDPPLPSDLQKSPYGPCGAFFVCPADPGVDGRSPCPYVLSDELYRGIF